MTATQPLIVVVTAAQSWMPANFFAGIALTADLNAAHVLSSQPANALRELVTRASSIASVSARSGPSLLARASHSLRAMAASSNILPYAGSDLMALLTLPACSLS